jgi:hypothetical protein
MELNNEQIQAVIDYVGGLGLVITSQDVVNMTDLIDQNMDEQEGRTMILVEFSGDFETYQAYQDIDRYGRCTGFLDLDGNPITVEEPYTCVVVKSSPDEVVAVSKAVKLQQIADIKLGGGIKLP